MSTPPVTAQPMPKNPNEAARDALAERASEMAHDAFERKIRREIKGYLPKFLWPLLPGEKGTVEGNLKKEAGKQISSWLWGAVFSLVFFLIFGVAVLGVLLIVAFAVITSL